MTLLNHARLAQQDFNKKIQMKNIQHTYLEDWDDGSLLGRPHINENIASATHSLGYHLHHVILDLPEARYLLFQ